MALFSESELQLPDFKDEDVPEYLYRNVEPSLHPIIKAMWRVERQQDWIVHARLYDRRMFNALYEVAASARTGQAKMNDKLLDLEKKFDDVVLVEKTKESMIKKYGPGAGAGAGMVLAFQFIEPIREFFKNLWKD